MTDASKTALKAYETKYGKKPKDAAALTAFVKANKELKTITQEQAKAVLLSPTTEKKENKKPQVSDKKETNTKNKAEVGNGEKSNEKKEKPLYEVGDKVLMSKDRMGVVRYVGEIPELGTGLWYGVELTDGSIGQSDGTVHGKKYFATEGKRALFGPASKIRRKMNDKDHKRHDSLMQLQQVKAESPRSDPEQSSRKKTLEDKSENEDSNSPLANGSVKIEKDIAVVDSQTAQNSHEKQPSVHSVPKEVNTKPKTQEEATDLKIEKIQSNGSEEIRKPTRSNTLKSSTGISGAEAYETLLSFILRQSDELRERLLDIFANPQLNPILVDSYSELKNMEKEEQEKLWNALLVRWRRFG